MKISAFELIRAATWPLMILIMLFAVGYGAVMWERSHQEYLTVKATSMRFVSSQGVPTSSNWNMSIVNNGTLTFILGLVCQRTPRTNDCNTVAPSFSGYNPYYLKHGQSTWFMLANVNTTLPVWELHLQGWAWTSNQAPSSQDIVNIESVSIPTTEWIYYNSTGNTFGQ